MTVEEILHELVEGNGDLIFDDELMSCKSCGAGALGAKSAAHAEDCLVRHAERRLHEMEAA